MAISREVERYLGLVEGLLAGRSQSAELEAAVSGFEGDAAALAERLAALAEQQARWRKDLVQAAKMAEVGMSMALVVHEMRQPLSAISGFCQLLRTDPRGTEAPGWIGEIQSQSTRMEQLIERLRRFVRSSEEKEEDSADVSEAVRESVAIFPKMPPGVSLSLEVPEGLPRAHIEMGQLVQVLTNLIGNARDAVETRAPGTILVKAAMNANAVEIVVADEGVGIPEDARPRLFEPFFTTKGEKGTGLGLYISREIVQHWGGALTLLPEARAPFQTMFVVRLAPATIASSAASKTPVAPRPLPKQPGPVLASLIEEIAERVAKVPRTRRVLIVDDDSAIRHALDILLANEEPMERLEAPDGARAIELLQRTGGAELMLLDLRMQGMTGIDLLRAAKQKVPSLESIVITGFPTHDSAMEAIALGSCDYLVKPFNDIVGLRARVREALQRRRRHQLLDGLSVDLRLWAERLIPLAAEMEMVQLKAPLGWLTRRLEGPAHALSLGLLNGADFVTLAGHLGESAEDAAQAQAELAKGMTDAVLVGPDTDPLQALEVLRATAELPYPPSLLWAAPIPEFATAQAILRAGVSAVLDTPLDARHLTAALKLAVQQRRERARARAFSVVLRELGIKDAGTGFSPGRKSA